MFLNLFLAAGPTGSWLFQSFQPFQSFNRGALLKTFKWFHRCTPFKTLKVTARSNVQGSMRSKPSKVE